MHQNVLLCSSRRQWSEYSRGVCGCLVLALALGLASRAAAAIIGTNVPAQPVTFERIAALPASQQGPWKKYLKRSQRQWQKDQAFFKDELRAHKMTQPITPPQGRDANSVPLDRDPAWYGGAEARQIADIVLSFQTPAGGWSKNLDMSKHLRAPGERFAEDNASPHPMPADYDTPLDLHWNYVGTFDNNATITQMRFLAQVIAALPHKESAPYRKAFLKGMDYIFASQYPNGGWPQVWPLQGGYHDAVTYNDDAMAHVMALLKAVTKGEKQYAFASKSLRARAGASFDKGVRCILDSQIRVGCYHTVWCQQHAPLTLLPTSARNYEMPSESSSESVALVELLMDLPRPSDEVVAAVHDAMAWFRKTEICDAEVARVAGVRSLVHTPGKGPLWPRFCQIGSDEPIFGDRDKTIHDTLADISTERRNGYGWYRGTPFGTLERFEAWSKAHPLSQTAAGQ
jgi:PelA/Pel-15E family pectate lyase